MSTAPVQIRPQWPFATRLGRDEDRGFVCINWIKTLRDSHVQQQRDLRAFQDHAVRNRTPLIPEHLLGTLPAQVPYHEYSSDRMKRIVAILARPNVVVQVAHNPEHPNHLFGFAVLELEPPQLCTVHYLYVRRMYRRSGIATELLAPLQHFNQVGHTEETLDRAAWRLIRANKSQFHPAKAWSP